MKLSPIQKERLRELRRRKAIAQERVMKAAVAVGEIVGYVLLLFTVVCCTAWPIWIIVLLILVLIGVYRT